MSDRPLPRPVSSTDLYLAAILDQLKKMDQTRPEDADAEAVGLIVLREPAVEATPLPDDLPGRDALRDAGYATLEGVPRDGKALTAVSGIGKVTANQILTYFKVNR